MPEFYNDLFQRNQPIIDKDNQDKISQLKVLIAGCGSTGGAAIEGLVRLGVQNFVLMDNGHYDLNNLNRQMVFQKDLGCNKAEVQAERILSVNPKAQVHFDVEGVTQDNIENYLAGIDFIFDAVDVTTSEGMQAKLLLHQSSFTAKIALLSALDLGFTQWVKSYNYHQGADLLGGKFDSIKNIEHPLKQLIHGFCGYDYLDYEISTEAIRLLTDSEAGACQIGCACFLLSALMTPLTLYWNENSCFPDLINFNLLSLFENDRNQAEREKLNQKTRLQLQTLMKGIA